MTARLTFRRSGATMPGVCNISIIPPGMMSAPLQKPIAFLSSGGLCRAFAKQSPRISSRLHPPFRWRPQPGSSISHWDPIAFPNQLMEPALNPDLTHAVGTVSFALKGKQTISLAVEANE